MCAFASSRVSIIRVSSCPVRCAAHSLRRTAMPRATANPAAMRTPSKIFHARVTGELSCVSDWCQFVMNDLVQDCWVDWFLQPRICRLIVVKDFAAGRNHDDWNHGPAPAQRETSERPERPGVRQSMTTRSGVTWLRRRVASRPSLATVTS